MQAGDTDPFRPEPSPWGQELCRRLLRVTHPTVQDIVLSGEHEAGALGTVLLGDLAAALAGIAAESAQGANDTAIREVIAIIETWVDYGNPHLINDVLSGFVECLEYEGDVGRQVLNSMSPKFQDLKLPEGFPMSFPSRREFAESY